MPVRIAQKCAVQTTGPNLDRSPLGDTLRTIAARLQYLAPSHRDPERYHVEKSELVAALRVLARRLS
jgi:hypothetical protein